MKQRITITKDNQEIFNGKIADVAIKTDYIIKKSIELFDDEDPCIIHQSYVVKEYVDVLLNLFKTNKTTVIKGVNFATDLDFLDYTDIKKLEITLFKK
jgi:hypothetical protein